MGNLRLTASGKPSTAHIVGALPSFMRDSALLDRIHAFIPGWELPKIMQSSNHLASGYGIVVDYLSEVFHQMSVQGSYSDIIRDRSGVGRKILPMSRSETRRRSRR